MPVGTFTNITADSVPVLDTWGWNYFWGCHHWVKWHALMAEKYGIKYANDTFIEHWERQTIGASPADCSTFNSDFIDYAKKAGFYNALFSGIAVITYPLGVVTELLFKAGEIIDNAGTSAVSISKMAKWVLPVAVIAAGTLGGIYLYNRYVLPEKLKAKQLKK